MKSILAILVLFNCYSVSAQRLTGKVMDASTRMPLEYCLIRIVETTKATYSDATGTFELPHPQQSATLIITHLGYQSDTLQLHADSTFYTVALQPGLSLQQVVITGNLKPVSRLESTVAIDVLSPELFKKSSAVCLFDAASMINGVQPQMSCNVCNAGELRINGMDGPYTLVLLDGMPALSSLSAVYGLNGIPMSLIERIEVMKGPASSLYGSEAMGGVINIITRDPECAPKFSVDATGSSWLEFSGDIGVSFKRKRVDHLIGIHLFNYATPQDQNNDFFMDIPLQERTSIFSKNSISLNKGKKAAIALRLISEDRNGGQMNFTQALSGSDRVYGESITTLRTELSGMWQLPFSEQITLQFSSVYHEQNSWYGTTNYQALQQVNFAQLFWEKTRASHSWLGGFALRHTFYDDNTPATSNPTGDLNQPMRQPLPGIFLQDEWSITKKHKVLLGWRTDYDLKHGFVHSPRFAFRWQPKQHCTFRAALGTGYRVVNLFAEDHAALSGARNVVITESLNPERSVNGTFNWYQKLYRKKSALTFDGSIFYSHFSNKIIADYDSHPNEIRYANLKGFAVSRGAALNTEAEFNFPLSILAGITFMDVFTQDENGRKRQQLHAPKWSGTFTISYEFVQNLKIDLNGRWYGPMRLPILHNDFRPEYSPQFCLLNLQVRKELQSRVEVYAGVRNLLNFVPKNPIMRPFDPFDRSVNDPINNPNGYTFDPSYTYAPLQGIRWFAGVRWKLSTD